jgi:hypothetical protein
MACGLPVILGGIGVIPIAPTEGTPAWVAVCAGLMFVLMGAAVIVGFAVAGGAAPGGELLPGTPFAVQAAQYCLGLGITGLMAAVFGWVAFGSGHRSFSTTITLPFVTRHPDSGELSGRVLFGIGAVLIFAMFVGIGIAGGRRLLTAKRGDPPRPLGGV